MQKFQINLNNPENFIDKECTKNIEEVYNKFGIEIEIF